MLNSENIHDYFFQCWNIKNLIKGSSKSSVRKVCLIFLDLCAIHWWQCKRALTFVEDCVALCEWDANWILTYTVVTVSFRKVGVTEEKSVLRLWALLLTYHVFYQHLNCKTVCFATYITILFFQTWILFPGTKQHFRVPLISKLNKS